MKKEGTDREEDKRMVEKTYDGEREKEAVDKKEISIKDKASEDIQYEEENEQEDYEENDLPVSLKVFKTVMPIVAVVVCLIVLGFLTFGNKNGRTKAPAGMGAGGSEENMGIQDELPEGQDAGQAKKDEISKADAGEGNEGKDNAGNLKGEKEEDSESPSWNEGQLKEPENGAANETEQDDLFAAMQFLEVDETVTAKEITNLRDIPSTENGIIIHSLKNGETVNRTGIGDKGWSRVIYNGQTLYAVTSYLTDDLVVHDPKIDDGIKTPFMECNDSVTAKIEVNLRSIPSVTNPDSVVVTLLKNGEYVTRTGINTDFGWSRVDYNGQTLYCISSYLLASE